MSHPEDLALIALGQIEATLAALRRAKRALIAWRCGDLQENQASEVILQAARDAADGATEAARASRALEDAIQPRLGIEPDA